MLRSMFAAVSGSPGRTRRSWTSSATTLPTSTRPVTSEHREFEDLLSQTLQRRRPRRPASPAVPTRRRSASACGSPASARTSHKAPTQQTGRSTDFAIQGDGFFVVEQGGAQAYTRNGSFSLDGHGQLVTADGGLVQGWQADQNGNVNTNASVGHREDPGRSDHHAGHDDVDQDRRQPARRLRGRHRRSTSRIDVNNSLGTSIPLRMEFTKVADTAGQRQLDGHDLRQRATPRSPGRSNVQFDTQRQPHVGGNITLTQAQLNTIPGTIGHVGRRRHRRSTSAPRPTPDRLTGAGGAQQRRRAVAGRFRHRLARRASASSQDGLITGVFSNGRTQALGQIALATFANPHGLIKQGGSLYTTPPSTPASRADRCRRAGRPRHALRRNARDVERRPRGRSSPT